MTWGELVHRYSRRFVRRLISVLSTIAMVLPCAVLAQAPPAQPQTTNWLSERVEVEVRLKTVAGTTAHLAVFRFGNLGARYLTILVPCWNKVRACPEIAGATVRLYITLPWSQRLNVTRFVLCASSECSLPAISPPIRANPGQSYDLRYDRVNAVWYQPPAVVTP